MRRSLFIFSILLYTPILAEEYKHLPMYGGIDRTVDETIIQQDILFIAQATRTFGTREHASKGYVERGFDHYLENKNVEAMQRFNEAWLLNPENPYVYLGFAVLLERDHNHCEAMTMFSTAHEKGLKESGFLADYAYTVSQCAMTKIGDEKESLFSLSNKLHEQATQTPDKLLLAYVYHSWAKAYVSQERTEQAKLMMEASKKLGGHIDDALIKSLQ